MPVEQVETLIVGGGQAGLAMSEQLSKRSLSHLVVERHRIVERWRTERWDGLHGNGPIWSDSMPGFLFRGGDRDAFATRDQIVEYFVAYAEAIAAPVRCGVNVTALRQRDGRAGFRAETSEDPIEAINVVAATGPFQRPVVPALIPPEAGIFQLHANAYRNPAQLPEGAVLVVGAGSSGAQIADELLRAGRNVYLSVGRHGRHPRRYRGRDIVWWMFTLGIFDVPVSDPPQMHVPIAYSGAYGGYTIDYRRMAEQGLVLIGRTEAFRDGAMHFADDLAGNLAQGDASYLSMLDLADAHVLKEGLDLPEDPEARAMAPDPACLANPIRKLNLRDAGIGAVIWATGYTLDFGWLDVPVFDDGGQPRHRRGVTDAAGLYFLGLSWLSRRASGFIVGLPYDASYLADHIAAARG